LRNKNIYTKKSQHTRPKFTQGSLLTTEPLTWVHTQQTLEASQTPVATNDPATVNFTAIKTWETQVSHTNQGTRTPTHTLKRFQHKVLVVLS
jgi:hypothetical protein